MPATSHLTLIWRWVWAYICLTCLVIKKIKFLKLNSETREPFCWLNQPTIYHSYIGKTMIYIFINLSSIQKDLGKLSLYYCLFLSFYIYVSIESHDHPQSWRSSCWWIRKMTSSSKIHMKCLYFITISCIVYNFLWVFWILLNISLSFNSNKRAWVNWMVIKLAANAPLKHEQWMDPIFQNSFFSFFVLLFVFECFCIPMYNNPLVKFNHTRYNWIYRHDLKWLVYKC